VHFRREWSTASDIGAKAVAVSVSDLGAMGAEPRVATLSLALPAGLLLADFDALADGVGEAAREAGLAIAGGNLTASPGPLILDVTAVGHVHPRKALRRDGARPGDSVYVTGTIGAGAAGLAWLERHGVPGETHDAWPAVRRACRPASSARAGVTLSRAAASRAAIDLSDGLADGLRRLADASGCGMTIDAAALPIDPAARRVFEALGIDAVPAGLAGGDDYELLFTVPPRSSGRFRAVRGHLGTTATRIGVVTAGPGLVVEGGPPGLDPTGLGFDHFAAR
jgi:thiamine-monophosphate kinase